MCAEGARFVWAGHRDDPEGVRREHPGWVHLVGGMVGVMAPAYATWVQTRNCEPGHSQRHPDGGREPVSNGSGPGHNYLAGARVYFSTLFFYLIFTLSLSLYKKEGSS